MQRYMIDTGTYGNGYSAEPDEDGLFVYADEAEARIAALEAQLAQYRWRRVEEEMPETWGGVIVAGPDRRTEAFIDEQGRWRWGGTANIIREFVPTHWMPLPPAPQEGE